MTNQTFICKNTDHLNHIIAIMPECDQAKDYKKYQEQHRDNLFNANHRNAMMQKYGYSEALAVSVKELMEE